MSNDIRPENAAEIIRKLLATPLAVGNRVLLCYTATITEIDEPDPDDFGDLDEWLSLEIRCDGSVTTFGAPYSAAASPELVTALLERNAALEQQHDAAVSVMQSLGVDWLLPISVREIRRKTLAALGADVKEGL